MKLKLIFLLATCTFISVYAGEIDKKTVVIPRQPKVWQTFPLSEVRLLAGSPFYQAMQVSRRYLLDMDIERMLNATRKELNLPEKAAYPGSNQPEGTRPGDLYHYISGISLMYAQTGDKAYWERAGYLVGQLALFDRKRDSLRRAKGEPYQLPYARLAEGCLILKKPDDAGYPWGGLCGNVFYGLHKQYAALRDAYLYCDNDEALQLWKKIAEPVVEFVLKVNPDLFDGFLDLEHGGMNAVFADLYALTGDSRYMDVSMKFNHQKVILNLADNKDVLYGRHANCQIPIFEGTARQYQLTGNEISRDATIHFLDIVRRHHTNCIGGNSCYERFGRPGETTKRLGYTSSETCNTYNMLKVALNTFEVTGDIGYMDYFERALYNHILASQDPETGGVTYYMALTPGGFKSYSDRFNLSGVWCCVGTGMENHSKYGEAIYFNNHQSLYVNLFIPSALNWSEKGLKVRLETSFPEENEVRLKIVENTAYAHPIYFRHPQWAEGPARFTVNGKPVAVKTTEEGYVCLQHCWKAGDEIACTYPQHFRLEAASDDPYMYTIFRGPIAYAAVLGADGMPKDRVRSAGDNNTFVPLNDIPTLIVDKTDLTSWLQKSDRRSDYQTVGAGWLNGEKKEVVLRPFYQTHHQRYSLYLKMYTPQEMKLRKKTVWDELRPSYPADEKAHGLQGEHTAQTFQAGHSPALGFNTWEKTRWGRYASGGGWFSYEMKVSSDAPVYLVATYWGNEAKDHEFDVVVDGQVIASENLCDKYPLTFYEQSYLIPTDITAGKKKVSVCFRAKPGKNAGVVFALKTTADPEKFPNYSFYF